ncbi:MAG: ABC transporter ATP-binding protein [bacterium]|nr:ABC transporter ATP-binding protein [bacterium]
MAKDIIQINGLSLSYGKKKVLDNVNVAFEKGKTTLIAGNNGAGKSSLLKCLAGILIPDSGDIRIEGAVPGEKIGFISDKMSLFEDFTLARGIDFHCRSFNVKTGDFDRSLLDRLKLDMNQPIKSLSIGERAVYHLSLLLSQKPEILLLDEIIHAVDPYLRELFLEALIGLIDDINTSVIMVNHTFSDTGRIPERVLIMEESRFVFDENSEDLNRKMKKIVTEKEIKDDIPVIFKSETPLYNEYYVYPFSEELAAGTGYEFQDVELTEIVKSFIGGYYAKKRV